MGLRLTTWNVNGIRNPFAHPPWRDQRTFAAMFDVLEADIVVFQETKIQRKDLSDDMVLIPGWDCYWSLPRHKKGYSGVVIYTRQSKCAPIRAEEGITGTLCPPGSSTSFRDLPEEQKIGGYPTDSQPARSVIDPATIDSEGRCVILEFPAFVLLGVYSPATRDESRDDFRIGFLNLLDARIRNLVSMGKRVFLTGDLNISPSLLDTANPEASMRKNGVTAEEWISTPSRRLLNHLLMNGDVMGEKDEGRERPVLWDICRGFHPSRTGMFTCWEQKVNARPGNHGSRIDYVLCSLAMKDWFCDSNIQEGLMGSDHCPVYAIFKNEITLDQGKRHLLDLMNPPAMFINGQRQRDYSAKDILPLSGRLIPEFDGRRSIREMFTRKPSTQVSSSMMSWKPITKEATNSTDMAPAEIAEIMSETQATSYVDDASPSSSATKPIDAMNKKRSATNLSTSRALKRSRSGSTAATPSTPVKGQQSLKGFFKPKTITGDNCAPTDLEHNPIDKSANSKDSSSIPSLKSAVEPVEKPRSGVDTYSSHFDTSIQTTTQVRASTICTPGTSPASKLKPSTPTRTPTNMQPQVHDPVASAESWSKLFTKPVAPRCEGHDEPCISLLTKKSGMNCGRSFWMCPRPLGPSGAKEKNTQWRCQTFIWCSDWNSSSA